MVWCLEHRNTEETESTEEERCMEEQADFDGRHRDLTDRIIACAIKVHRTLGPGFVESMYENALAIELELAGIPFKRQLEVKLTYAGRNVGIHRLDMLVADKIIVELKAKEQICEADKATTLSYLKATRKEIALILNFGKPTIDIKRLGNRESKP
jgi:GxxExxY protein